MKTMILRGVLRLIAIKANDVVTKPPMFVTMPTIRQQKCIADLGKQRRSQGRCFSLICWKRRY